MVGGRVQLLIGNNNNDQAQMFVSDCAFQVNERAVPWAIPHIPPCTPIPYPLGDFVYRKERGVMA